jgi:hypothetical protein
MCKRLSVAILTLLCVCGAPGEERQIASLRNFCGAELKSAGIELHEPATIHIKALGGGGDKGWTYKSDQLFAYAWIINATTRECVWKMSPGNSSRSGDDLAFDGTLDLAPGSYEVYFTAYAFAYHTAFSHFNVNIDHRNKDLFGESEKKRNFFSWFKDWFSDDIGKSWQKRCQAWGVDLLVDASVARQMGAFEPPKRSPDIVLQITGAGDNAYVRKGFTLSAPTTIAVYALGEKGGEWSDYAWIQETLSNDRVWEMREDAQYAGGAVKNQKALSTLTLDPGDYTLTYVSDGSHSEADWNQEPPDDPLFWGVTLSIPDGKERKNFKEHPVEDFKNIIVQIIRVGDDEFRSEGFTLKQDARVRIYAIGERSSERRQMADYAAILDAKTRAKVWTMDVDRTVPAGGASKNRLIDETIPLPRGSYLVTYQSDDSHAYNDWNSDPPYDQEHYGVTVMGAGEKFAAGVVGKYVEERDRSIVAQLVRMGNDEDRSERFELAKPSRLRIYAIGEGQNREMYDYGWIEDAKTGNVVWEMTYAMTFHAGGGRKNRSVNTSILLDKGEYRVHWVSDDSHSFGDWNVEPPEDQQYWGITLYREDAGLPPPVPEPPQVPHPGVPSPKKLRK